MLKTNGQSAQARKIAILVDNYFEEAEFSEPLEALEQKGYEVEIIGTNDKKVYGMDHAEPTGERFIVDKLIDEVQPDQYDALVLPGGAINADNLRINKKAQNWIKTFMEDNKPIAAICHAPWLLISAGLAKGKKLTSYKTIKDDLQNAGANWVDQAVVIDKNLITSRQPDDIAAFNNALTNMLAAA